MNKKKGILGKISLTGILAIISFLILYFLVDIVFNSFVAEWFHNKFFIGKTIDRTMVGMDSMRVLFNWDLFKRYIIIIMFWLILSIAFIIYFSVTSLFKRKKRKAIQEIECLIRSLMAGDGSSEKINLEYIEIVNQIKTIMLIKEEDSQKSKREKEHKDDMITYLAHDLKTPLTSIIGYLRLFIDVPEMPKEVSLKYIRRTLDKAYRLESLINEFFEITRYNVHKIPLCKENLRLYYMLVQITEEFFPIMNKKNIGVKIHCDEEILIYADSEKMARVFNNILKNAIAYGYPNTAIDIYADKIDHQVEISFRNEGVGIPEEQLELIFERFFRVDESRNASSGGAGLGLAIAREIVSQHTGVITAYCRDKYVIFKMVLPMDEE